jgi:hypothetical protein
MKNIRDKKKSKDSIKHKIHCSINAVTNNISDGIENAFNRSEERRASLLRVADRIAKKVEDNEAQSDINKQNFKAKLDTLKVQLSLGKAEIRTGIKEKRKSISNAIRDFEAQLESDLEFEDELLEKAWIEDSIAFEEEINALHLQNEIELDEVKENRDAKISEIKEKFRSLKQELKNKKDSKIEDFNEDLEELNKKYAEIAQYYPLSML